MLHNVIIAIGLNFFHKKDSTDIAYSTSIDYYRPCRDKQITLNKTLQGRGNGYLFSYGYDVNDKQRLDALVIKVIGEESVVVVY